MSRKKKSLSCLHFNHKKVFCCEKFSRWKILQVGKKTFRLENVFLAELLRTLFQEKILMDHKKWIWRETTTRVKTFEQVCSFHQWSQVFNLFIHVHEERALSTTNPPFVSNNNTQLKYDFGSFLILRFVVARRVWFDYVWIAMWLHEGVLSSKSKRQKRISWF